MTARTKNISIMDATGVIDGATPTDTFRNSVDLAQHAERWGYRRYWLTEHHNIAYIASAATSVVIGHIAANTSTIRVGSGGIMLPNHAPLAIAEQFGTLESLFPGRIDLGLGRAPGANQPAARALRRGVTSDDFPEQLNELRSYMNPTLGGAAPGVRAIPGEGLNIPIILLGSSNYGAKLAAQLGLPFSFGGHFSPDYLLPALELYHRNFRPSAILDKPYVILAINAVVAPTNEEAEWLFTTAEQEFLNVMRGNQGILLQPPTDMDVLWNQQEKAAIRGRMLPYAAIGSPDTVQRRLKRVLEQTKADELMISGMVYDHDARLRSFELLADLL
ncbi:LLM class flavin-dependent oxidoreductase [Paenibacillus sp. GCM10012306]|uniref:LLM class flavin-dependent oxidoreductase n=1 Tax=Paenibacillus sp. GCM10012306 TaxID=3317342 RepID=UPI0036070084